MGEIGVAFSAEAGPLSAGLAVLQRAERQHDSWDGRAAALAMTRMGRADLIETPPRKPLGGGQSIDLQAWYDGLNAISPESPAGVVSQARSFRADFAGEPI